MRRPTAARPGSDRDESPLEPRAPDADNCGRVPGVERRMREIPIGQSEPDRNGAAHDDAPAAPGNFGIAVVVTVRNDRDELADLLTALRAQTHPPDEVIVVDGGSSDGTRALLAEERALELLPLTVIDAPGANISAGRNIGIDATRYERVASRTPAAARSRGGSRRSPRASTRPTSSAAPTGSTRARRSSAVSRSRSTRRPRRSATRGRWSRCRTGCSAAPSRWA